MAINRSRLFTIAWRCARRSAAESGRTLRAVFAEALRQAWATLRDPQSLDNVIAREVDTIIAGIRAEKAAGTFRLVVGRGWRFANAHV